MAELQCIQIEITKAYGQSEWRDDLRQIMLKAGAENRGVVFLFSDAQVFGNIYLFHQIKNEQMALLVAPGYTKDVNDRWPYVWGKSCHLKFNVSLQTGIL